MRKALSVVFSRASLVFLAATVVVLVGCSSQDPELSRDAAPSTTQEASSPDPAEQARELYTEVLSDSEHIEFNYPHEDRGPDTGTPGPKSGVLAKKSGDVL